MSRFEVNSFQVPNVVVDELLSDLSGSELKIYLYIIRKTKGWHKEKEAISINNFVQDLKISNRQVINSCNSLARKGLISVDKKDKKTTVFKIKSYEKSSQVASEKSSQDESVCLVKKVHITCEESSQVASEKSSQDILYKDNIKDTIQKTEKNIIKKVFKKPSLDELKNYIKAKQFSVNAETFFSYYEANGWRVGKNPMKDWKATVRYWQSQEKNNFTRSAHKPQVGSYGWMMQQQQFKEEAIDAQLV